MTCGPASLNTRWPDKEPLPDHSQGVQLATMQALARYWANDYDWRRCEARLNALPQFMTEIDGLDIHFIHVRSKHENALPLIITHGWPGSIIEQLKVIGPLTDPTAHGGSADDAFHVVIPSLPGYGFSGKPRTPAGTPTASRGLGRADEAARLHALRRAGRRLGRRGHRPDGVADAAGLIGIHTNMPASSRPTSRALAACTGGPAPPGCRPTSSAPGSSSTSSNQGLGYALEMANRPQTLYGAGGLAGRPGGLDARPRPAQLRADIARVFAGHPGGDLTRDEVLDNITLYWLTNTGVSSARLYWENKLRLLRRQGRRGPDRGQRLPGRDLHAPRSWTEKAYPNLIYYNSPGAATSPPGNSRRCSPTSSAPGSGRYAR